jgi:hypothetical protein
MIYQYDSAALFFLYSGHTIKKFFTEPEQKIDTTVEPYLVQEVVLLHAVVLVMKEEII